MDLHLLPAKGNSRSGKDFMAQVGGGIAMVVGDKLYMLLGEGRGHPSGQVNCFPFCVVCPKDAFAGDKPARDSIGKDDKKSLGYIVGRFRFAGDMIKSLVINGQHYAAAKVNMVATLATDEFMDVVIGINLRHHDFGDGFGD